MKEDDVRKRVQPFVKRFLTEAKSASAEPQVEARWEGEMLLQEVARIEVQSHRACAHVRRQRAGRSAVGWATACHARRAQAEPGLMGEAKPSDLNAIAGAIMAAEVAFVPQPARVALRRNRDGASLHGDGKEVGSAPLVTPLSATLGDRELVAVCDDQNQSRPMVCAEADRQSRGLRSPDKLVASVAIAPSPVSEAPVGRARVRLQAMHVGRLWRGGRGRCLDPDSGLRPQQPLSQDKHGRRTGWRLTMRWLVLNMAVLAAIGCTTEHDCREGTVLVHVHFAVGADLVDGLSVRYRLDEGLLNDVPPLSRPPGTTQGSFALAVKNYGSHRSLLLRHAPRRGGELVGPWQEQLFALTPTCSVVDITVSLPTDAGTMFDGAGLDVQAIVGVDARATEAGPVDGRVDRPLGADAGKDVEPDQVAVAGPDTAELLVADGPFADVPLEPPVDAPPDGPSDVTSSASFDSSLVSVLDAFHDSRAEHPTDGAADAPAAAADAPPDVAQDVAGLSCRIDNRFYEAGAVNPDNSCQTCQPTSSPSFWTLAADGFRCSSGHVCQAGLCRLGCWINGSFVQSSATKPGNTCTLCNPIATEIAWTFEKDGTPCGSNQVCYAGECVRGCWVDGKFHLSESENPNNGCQTCQPEVLTTGWSPAVNGKGCGTGKVCSAGTCLDGCWLDGAYRAEGEKKSDNACLSCQPSTSTSTWGVRCAADGQPCSAPTDCLSGACNAYYPDLDRDGQGGKETTAVQLCGASAPDRFSASNSDCCDSDPNAYQGQTALFSVPNACGSYDYNCDNQAQARGACASCRKDSTTGCRVVTATGWCKTKNIPGHGNLCFLPFWAWECEVDFRPYCGHTASWVESAETCAVVIDPESETEGCVLLKTPLESKNAMCI
jgi:hypothetical protein